MSKIFQKGRHTHSLVGIGPNALDNHPHTNCHYADDTILFLKADNTNIENAWWALFAFEALSGIKVNYTKTSMYSINTPDITPYALIFQCTSSSFPMHYLGLPLHTQKLRKKDWFFLIDKIEKRLQNWKGSLLSIGGRVTLLNSVLSSIPLYFLSVYKIPKFVIKKIDQIRCRFLWQGTTEKRKYSLINWQTACLAKEFGGLGIIDLTQMNISLLLKWWWKLKDPSYSSAWKHMLFSKYNLITSSTPISEFWSAITSLHNLGTASIEVVPGRHTNVLFWTDIWYQQCTMATRFPYLYEICTNSALTLQQVINSQGGAIKFRRSLFGILHTEWLEVLEIISHLSFTHLEDQLSWRWDAQGKFTVRSLYKFLNYRGITPRNAMRWWKIPIPLKIRIFMWLAHKNRILTTDNLLKRGWQGQNKCQFCHQPESINHLFVTCTFARQIWFFMGACQHINVHWVKISDIIHFAHQLPTAQRTAFLLVYSAICWTIWKHRNELCFNSGKVKSVRQMILLIISLVTYWTGQVNQQVKDSTALWLPVNLDAIPLAVWSPEEEMEDTPAIQVLTVPGAQDETGTQMVLYDEANLVC